MHLSYSSGENVSLTYTSVANFTVFFAPDVFSELEDEVTDENDVSLKEFIDVSDLEEREEETGEEELDECCGVSFRWTFSQSFCSLSKNLSSEPCGDTLSDNWSNPEEEEDDDVEALRIWTPDFDDEGANLLKRELNLLDFLLLSSVSDLVVRATEMESCLPLDNLLSVDKVAVLSVL